MCGQKSIIEFHVIKDKWMLQYCEMNGVVDDE